MLSKIFKRSIPILLLAIMLVVFTPLCFANTTPEGSVQVRYEVKYLTEDGETNLLEWKVRKLGFSGESVTETARKFDGYTLKGEKNQTLELNANKNNLIIFYYTVGEEEILEEAPKKQVKYEVKYLDSETGNLLNSYKIVKMAFSGEQVVEKAWQFDGYESIGEATKTVILSNENKQEIVFYYNKLLDVDTLLYKVSDDEMGKVISSGEEVLKGETPAGTFAIAHEGYKFLYWKNESGQIVSKKSQITPTLSNDAYTTYIFTAYFEEIMPNDDVPLSEFVKNKMNYDEPVFYQNINFVGDTKKLKDYITKVVYTRKGYANFITTEAEKDEAFFDLFDRGTDAGAIRYQKGYEIDEIKTFKDGSIEYQVRFNYMVSKDKMQEAEDTLEEFVKQNITDSMSDYEKALLINDYIIDIAKPAVDDQGNTIKPENDPYKNYFASTLITEGTGVCEAYAVTFSRLAEMSGLNVRLIPGIAYPNEWRQNTWYYNNHIKPLYDKIKEKSFVKRLNHGWSQVQIDGDWYNVDVYWSDVFYGYNTTLGKRQFFLISDERLKETSIRIWDEDYAMPAPKNYSDSSR